MVLDVLLDLIRMFDGILPNLVNYGDPRCSPRKVDWINYANKEV